MQDAKHMAQIGWLRRRLLVVGVASIAAGCSQAHRSPELQVTNVLADQVDAWNRGDLDRFLSHYWQSEQLTFSGGGQTQAGWVAVAERYRRSYPDAGQMGRLEFSDLQLSRLGQDAILALGRWRLTGDRAAEGVFSLVFRRIDGRWQISHDHTSATHHPPPEPQGGD